MVANYRYTKVLALAAGLVMSWLPATSTIAQQAAPQPFTLSDSNPGAEVGGSTNGIFALSNIAGRDRRGNICVGFADSAPNHVMVLQQNFDSLTLQVNSGGSDTTLLVQGPDDSMIRCGEDTDRRNPDAQIQDQNWAAGTYRIWVGSHNQGQRHSYSLSVKP
ncbi:hypothetical protein IQ254_01050 [Nodosilinea sp. LEGE 07088]|uniref:hypothetical protein n=1 Tax=Nodosilinea sp. LEGE 07088 TaxID=2777968 RepID=UPI0018804E7F|nr:hypothetical protein [Nodosilinea sp. LEGE 07088]MBE9135804.1 hypothetical protein [Nodosilinea sp. LEGE 07088]